MIESFATGFVWMLRVLMGIIGGVVAVGVCALVLFILAFVAGMIFHLITELMARQWEKTGKQPKNKLGQIIMRRRANRSDGEV